MTVENFIEQQSSPHTRRAYRQDLTRWFGFLGDRLPTEATVVEFKRTIEQALAPASAARCFAACRSFYRYEGEGNPFDRVKPPARVINALPKTPSDVAVNRLVAAVDTSDLPGKRHAAVISLLLNGLRAAEVAGLAPEDLTFEPEYEAWVLRVVGKGRKMRLVPANAETVEAVKTFQYASKVDSAWLLHDYDGSQLTVRQVEEAVYKWAKVAGIEGMHPHALRHHYATRLTRAGVNVLHLQKLLGHARADTTQVYVGLDLSDLVEAAGKDPRAGEHETQLAAVTA